MKAYKEIKFVGLAVFLAKWSEQKEYAIQSNDLFTIA